MLAFFIQMLCVMLAVMCQFFIYSLFKLVTTTYDTVNLKCQMLGNEFQIFI